MRILIESDQAISEINIKFADGTVVTKTQQIEEPLREAPHQPIPEFEAPVRHAHVDATMPATPVPLDDRAPAVDKDFASVEI